jgi:predicted NAD/FAD-binding protein
MALTPVFWSSMSAPTHLISLLAELGVETAKSDMSFSVKVPDAHLVRVWSGAAPA